MISFLFPEFDGDGYLLASAAPSTSSKDKSNKSVVIGSSPLLQKFDVINEEDDEENSASAPMLT